MEKTPPNSNTSQDKVKDHLIENRDEEPSCSSSTNETLTSTSEPSGSNTEKDGRTIDASNAPAGRSSPDPSCAICLESLQNKSFTNGCLHMFCFKCLVAWSKIKPECPLCKQPFKSIIHNVKEDFQYDTYQIRNRSTKTYSNLTNTRDHSYDSTSSAFIRASSSEQRFCYRTTLTSDRLLGRNHPMRPDTTSALRTSLQMGSLRLQIESHRMRYAPHTVSVISTTHRPSTDRRPSTFRRGVYRQNLWVKSERANDRIRLVSPEFFNRNPACTHRLIPWLNRELVVLLHNNETQIVYLLELIMTLITRYDINSPEFFMHIQPYMRKRTSHFIHEFYNFASSPFEMDDYDGHVTYETLRRNPADSPLTDMSISDEDLIDVENVEVSSSTPSITRIDGSQIINNLRANRSRAANTACKHRNSLRSNHSIKVTLKRNPETDSWITVMGPLPLMHKYTSMNNFTNTGPSTSSGFSTRNMSLYDAPSMSISPLRIQSSSDDDDDDCLIVDEVKPRKERTPEIIDLSSDEEAPPIVDISSPESNDFNLDSIPSPYYPPNPFASSPESNAFNLDSIPSPYSPGSPVSNDLDSVPSPTSPVHSGNHYSPVTPENPFYSFSSPIRRSDSSSSIECLYTYKPPSITPLNEGITIDLSKRRSPKRNVSYTSVIKETSAFNNALSKSSISIDLSEQASTSKSPSVVIKDSFNQETKIFCGDARSSVSSKIVVPNASANQSNSYWNAPSISRKRSGSYFDNSSTESCSETTPSKPLKKRKVKLKSVVAHFSFDKSDEKTDSCHRLSRKKRKDKKKKKKKHSRKHKYRIYSDSETSS